MKEVQRIQKIKGTFYVFLPAVRRGPRKAMGKYIRRSPIYQTLKQTIKSIYSFQLYIAGRIYNMTLPIFPTTVIGSWPSSKEVQKAMRDKACRAE